MKHQYLLPILLLIAGCTTLGTKATIYQPSINTELKTIGFVIVPSTFPDHSISAAADSVMIQSIQHHLHFQTKSQIVYLGTAHATNLDSSARLKYANIDALLACEAHVMQMVTHDRSKRFTTRIQTNLIKCSDLSVIASTYFDTKLGKSYLHYPFIEGAIHDGVAGALQPLHKIFRSTKPSPNSVASKGSPVQ